MGRNVNDVFQQVVQRPEHDRATLAGLLIETLDPVSEPDVEAAWSEGIERRSLIVAMAFWTVCANPFLMRVYIKAWLDHSFTRLAVVKVLGKGPAMRHYHSPLAAIFMPLLIPIPFDCTLG